MPMDATGVYLTPQAVSKLFTCPISEIRHTKPVVQVIDIKRTIEGFYRLVLSDGSNFVKVYTTDKVLELVSSKKLTKGSIVQLMKFKFGSESIFGRPITVKELYIICSKYDIIIGNPKPLYDDPNDKYRLSSDDDSENDDDYEPDQKEDFLDPTQKCSCSQDENNKRRKLESSEAIAKDISRISEMLIKKSTDNDMGACFEKLEKIGWGIEDPMYDTAILLFGESADYRKVWLHLKPESCGKWVKNAGSKFGLLG